jgi:hypothetical protein
MKIPISSLKVFCGLALIALFIFSSSCKKEKDQQIPPDIAFKTGAGYISSNATVGRNDTLQVGITASKTEDKDLLVRFVVTQQYDADQYVTTLLNESFNEDTYSKDMTIITRKIAGIETYTYTIINRDGLTKTVTLVLTVK